MRALIRAGALSGAIFLSTSMAIAAPGGNGNGLGLGLGGGNAGGIGGGIGIGRGGGPGAGAPLPALGATLFGQAFAVGGVFVLWRRRRRKNALKA